MALRLKEVMKEVGISGKELAARINTTPQYVSNVVSGRQNMSLSAIEEVSSILGVPVWQLFVSPEEVASQEFVMFVHHRGKSHIPASLDEIMAILKEWNEDGLVECCHTLYFSHLREHYPCNTELQHRLDDIDAMLP